MRSLVRLFYNSRVSQITEAVADLPPSARLLPQIQSCLSNPISSTAEVIDLLRLDPALTAKAITGANRAYFGGVTPCKTLDEAVARIGFDEVYRIVAMIAARGLFQTDMPVYESAEGDFLRDSLAVAVLLPILNTTAKIQVRGDELFTIGLLHAIGKMGIQAYAKSKGLQIKIDVSSTKAMVAAEKRFFKATHPEVGAALLEEWRFTDRVVEVVRFYTEPDEAPEFTNAAQLLQLAVSLKEFVYDRSIESEGARLVALESACVFEDKRIPAAIERAREMFDVLLGP